MSSVEVLRAGALGGVAHGFLARTGGVSTGAVASLNCGLGSGDDPARVAENRRRAADAVLPGATLVGPYQVHSAICHVVTEPWPHEARPEGDAVVTDRPGILLSVVTADCAPVLLADPAAGVVGAAHAGWRGALDGVAEATVAAMETLGAERTRIVAAIGPCIALASYEVDAAFRERFLARDPASAGCFAEGPAGKPHFDLESYVAGRLAAAGIGAIERLGLDTYAGEERFYSYRRATHRGEPGYGRLISLIGLAGG